MGRNYGVEKYTEEDVQSAMWVPFFIGMTLGAVSTVVLECIFVYYKGWI